jgi:hypothetical protein
MTQNKKRRWHVWSREINELVYAADQFEAFDMLRSRPAEEFGLIVQAEVDEDAEPFPVRTSLLMYRWYRDEDARRFIELGLEHGMPDTTQEDLAAAGRRGK